VSNDSQDVKRFNLVMPAKTFARVEAAAAANGTTATEAIRTFIRLGLWISEAQQRGEAFILRDTNDKETELILVV
jgi:hypothetical protein